MLVTNQRLDKLAAMHVDFVDRGMLPLTHNCPSKPVDQLLEGDELEYDALDNFVTGNVILARVRGNNELQYQHCIQRADDIHL